MASSPGISLLVNIKQKATNILESRSLKMSLLQSITDIVYNAQNIGMIAKVIEELVRNESFIETCNFFRTHAVHHYQQTRIRLQDK
jgi:hypothetical protein